jgi:hypothetical protein
MSMTSGPGSGPGIAAPRSGVGHQDGSSSIWPGSGFTFPEDVSEGPASLTTSGLVSAFESTPVMARKAHTRKSSGAGGGGYGSRRAMGGTGRHKLGRLSSSPVNEGGGYLGASSSLVGSSSRGGGLQARYQRKKKIIRGEKMMADMQVEFLDVQRIVERQKVRREERVVGDYLTMINRVRQEGSKSAPKSLSKSQSFFY